MGDRLIPESSTSPARYWLPRLTPTPQLAADAEARQARQGRGGLGELERGALGKGKVQAAAKSAAALHSSLSGERGRVWGVGVVAWGRVRDWAWLGGWVLERLLPFY